MRQILLALIVNAIILGGCESKQSASSPVYESDAPRAASSGSVSNSLLTPSSTAFQQTSVIYEVRSRGKKVALTFDDGPDHKYTPQILDILRKYNIHATFFLVGEHAEKYPDMVKRIKDEGHAVGNHTWDHQDLEKLSTDGIKDEITKADTELERLTGGKPTLFRAPYGAVSAEVTMIAAETGHQMIGWSVDTMDWDGKSIAQIFSAVRKEGKPGSIILQHSAGGKNGNLSNTVAALPQIIAYFQKNGYTFVTVPELLSEK